MNNIQNSLEEYFQIMEENKRDFILETLKAAIRFTHYNRLEVMNSTILALDDLDNLIIKQLLIKKIKPDDLELFYKLIKIQSLADGEMVFSNYSTKNESDKRTVLDKLLQFYKSIELLNEVEKNSTITKLREKDKLNAKVPKIPATRNKKSNLQSKV